MDPETGRNASAPTYLSSSVPDQQGSWEAIDFVWALVCPGSEVQIVANAEARVVGDGCCFPTVTGGWGRTLVAEAPDESHKNGGDPATVSGAGSGFG